MKILNTIRDSGGEIGKRELTRKTRELSKRDRDQILNDLIESEQVIKDVVNNGKKPKTVFLLNEEEGNI